MLVVCEEAPKPNIKQQKKQDEETENVKHGVRTEDIIDRRGRITSARFLNRLQSIHFLNYKELFKEEQEAAED